MHNVISFQWQCNYSGQINVPGGLTDVIAIAAGGEHSLALRADGTVVAWGDNRSGQTNVPSGLSNVIAIAAGSDHSLALRSDGTVVAWGANWAGQTNVPSGLANVIAIAAGEASSLAIVGGDQRWQPDLVVQNVSFTPGSVSSGGGVGVGFRIRNAGSGAAVATQARLRLSADTVLTRYDWPLSPLDVFIPALAPGGHYDFSGQFTVPATTPQGEYYVGVFADRDNRANQSNIANDAGLSATRLTVQSGGVTAPTITQPPQSRIVTAGENVTFTVGVAGTGPFSYQWRFNGNRLIGATGASLTLSGVVVSQSGNYSVEVANAGGVASSPEAGLLVNPPPNAPPPPPSQPSVGTLYCPEFDPSLPTVVITHGWQWCPFGLCNPRLPEWVTEMEAAIRERLRLEGLPANASGARANIIAYDWRDAWTHAIHKAGAYAYDHGASLAGLLKQKLPSDYAGKMHFIGHSYGTVVNATAVSQLAWLLPQVKVAQFTILDAPILSGGVDENTYHELLVPAGRVQWVDNYIASSVSGTGRKIPGTSPNGGLWVATTHPGIHAFYQETITNETETRGFYYSALLPNWSNRPAPQVWVPNPRPTGVFRSALEEGAAIGRTLGGRVVREAIWNGTVWVAGTAVEQTRSVIRMTKDLLAFRSGGIMAASGDDPTATNSGFAFDLTFPAEATALTFDFLFTEPGSGDWLTVEFNETLLWSFRGENFNGTNFFQASVLVGHLAGQSGILTVTLHSAGDAPAEVLVSNFEFQGTSRPRLGEPRRLANGVLEFTLTGEIANSYRIEYSTNLATWQPLTNAVCTAATVTISDPAAAGAAARFYRAVSQ